VAVRDGRIVRYEKGSADPELDHIDAGLLVLTARAIAGLTPGQPASLDRDVVPSLVEDGHLAAYITPQRFYEIGSPSGLEEFTKLVKEKGFAFVGRLP
jgi:NDP-sugar pyrophosphorylase family protein